MIKRFWHDFLDWNDRTQPPWIPLLILIAIAIFGACIEGFNIL